MAERLLTTSEAADWLGTSGRTLESWRLVGDGPVFCKLGRRLVRYSPADLEAFAAGEPRVNTAGQPPP